MITIIGGPHQGFQTRKKINIGSVIEIQDSKYTVRKFKTGNPRDKVLYAAPLHWDNAMCFNHLISMAVKHDLDT